MPELPAEAEALRQEVRRLLYENQQLRAQLSTLHRPTNSVHDDADGVLGVIEKEGEVSVRDIARRLKFHPAEVERLLEDLEFEGYVRSRLSVKGTYYSLTPSGRKYLAKK